MTKPSDCTCGFPEVHAQTATGHRANCPAHRRWLDGAIASGAYRPGPGRPSPEAGECDCATRRDGDPNYPANWGKPASQPVLLTGHYRDCPAHDRIATDYRPTPEPTRPAMEDRGIPVWIWANHSYEMFQPFDDATSRYEVSAPIGWELHPDPRRGVVLRSVFRKVLTAHDALNLATCAEEGFRVRHQQRIGAAHIGV